MISIILVDDHKILLDGIESLLSLEEDLSVVAKLESGEALLESDQLETADVIVLDINMKGLDGLQTLAQLKERSIATKVILMTTYDELKLVNQAFELGAKGYVTKSSASDYLVEGIRTVHKKDVYYSPDIKEKILLAFTGLKTKEKKGSRDQVSVSQLTTREVEVLKLIAQQYTSDEIAEKLFIAKSTVDTHRKNLIYKLNVKNAVGLGLYAERNGLI